MGNTSRRAWCYLEMGSLWYSIPEDIVDSLEDSGKWRSGLAQIKQCGGDDKTGDQWPEIPICWAWT